MQPRVRTVLIGLAGPLIGGVAGALGAWLAALPLGPEPELHDRDFRVVRDADDPLEVSPEVPLHIPLRFGDCELFADVELGAGVELDLVVRKVEPSLRHGDMPLYHGRFSVFRLSTERSGPACLTREQALFDDGSVGGHLLEAGRPATIVLEARGRTVRALVAGERLELDATDAHGAFAFVARGGIALIRMLEIRALPRPLGLLPWAWAGIAGALFGLALGRGRTSLARLAGSLVFVPAVGFLAGLLVLSHLVPDSEPWGASVVIAGLAGLPLAAACARRARGRGWAVAVGCALLAFEATARLEQPRLAPLEDPRLALYFGWGSATAPADALECRLSGRVVHAPTEAHSRVMFLGGGMLFEGGDLERYLGALSAAAAARKLGEPVEDVVVPTVYSHALQQLLLLERFYVDAFEPDVVVFGIPPWEAEPSEKVVPRDVLEGRGGPPSGFGSVVLSLWRQAARRPELAPSGGRDLRKTLDELAALAKEHGFRVLLMDDPGLPRELRAAVDAAVVEHGFPLLRRPWILDGPIDVEPLASALARLLR